MRRARVPLMIAPGKTIASPTARYLVQSERGRGGFGIAWRATRQADGQAVVLKELRLDRLKDWKAMQLFEREAKVMSELSHPGKHHGDTGTIGGLNDFVVTP